MVAPQDFSALYCPPRFRGPPPSEKSVLTGWSVEDTKGAKHDCFDGAIGEYTVAVDGLYSLVVDLIPIGNAHLEHEQTRRVQVEYALRITEPPSHPRDTADDIESEFLDVGSVSFGQMRHLRAGNVISCLRMPAAVGHNCVRLQVTCIQRKKKRPRAPEPTKKELKKRRKMKRRAESIASSLSSAKDTPPRKNHPNSDTSRIQNSSEDDDDSDGDSDWSDGFESDTTEDDLPHSNRGVGRLAKRFKGSAGSVSIV